MMTQIVQKLKNQRPIYSRSSLNLAIIKVLAFIIGHPNCPLNKFFIELLTFRGYDITLYVRSYLYKKYYKGSTILYYRQKM